MTPHVGVFPFFYFGFAQTERSRLETRLAILWGCSTSSSMRREKTSIRASIVSSRALTRSSDD